MSLTDRALRPYRPVNLVASNTGTAVRISWRNRNRLTRQIIKQSDPTETPEAGQTTTVQIYGDAGTLLRTVAGLTGTSYDYTNTNEVSDAGGLQNRLIFRLKAVRDGYESLTTPERSAQFDRVNFVIDGTDRVFVGTDRVIDT